MGRLQKKLISEGTSAQMTGIGREAGTKVGGCKVLKLIAATGEPQS